MKVLITGGAGFIGSHLTECLLQAGCEIAVLDNLQSGSREHVPAAAQFIEMDVRDSALAEVMERERFDAVVHLAGQTMVQVSVADPYYDASVNIMGTVNLLEACRKTGVKRVVFASTAASYGDNTDLPLMETSAVGPTSFYGLSKLTVESYLALYESLYGLSYVALRFANVYGERQGDRGEGGVISIFAKKIARGEGIAVFGDGGQTRDFIYAGDIAAGILQALRTESCNTVYNLSTNTESSVNDVVRLLAEFAGRNVQPDYQPPRAGDIYRSVLSNARATTGLDWKPIVALRDGLQKTYQYFAEHAKA